MRLNNHRLIGIIRIESPVFDIAGGEDDDSTLGGLFAGFTQRSLLSCSESLSRLLPSFPSRNVTIQATPGSRVTANLQRLASDLEQEFLALGEVSA